MIKQNKIRQVLAFVILFATLSLAITLVLKISSGDRKVEELPKLPQNIGLSLDKIHFTETKDGVRKSDLFAENGEYDKARDVTRLTGVRLVLHESGSSGEIALNADHADYYNASKDVKLSGNIVARSASGMEFTTGRASYEASRSRVVSDDRVTFTDGRMSVEGVGMELAVKTRDVRILKDVKATIKPGSKG
ncbi:MAG: LPS export ABC transporter periplasmic protein LptC [Desulfuromonadales bacterium]|nr:MAG: LPS export ABC transporter periplasmic protein LptC [Desulfuromonadales bacterium]